MQLHCCSQDFVNKVLMQTSLTSNISPQAFTLEVDEVPLNIAVALSELVLLISLKTWAFYNASPSMRKHENV